MPEYPRVLDSLPDHGAPLIGETEHRLRIVGLVRQPMELTATQLERLPQRTVIEDFDCREGWVVPAQRWSGALVGDLLDAAGATAEGTYVEFAAGDFRLTLDIEQARGALVALDLNDQPLPRQHGGPMRLYAPGEACFTSIKWLDRLEVRRDRGTNTAEQIALERLAATGA